MTKHYTDEGTLLIRNSDIKDGKFEFGDNPIYLEKTFAEKNETRMHQIGDVITVHTGDVGTSAVITENEAKSIGFATIVTRPNPKIIDSNYLCSFLNTDKHKKWAVSISTGDGRTNYNLGDYFELVVPVPSIAEQKKIASYIQKLNRLITLHQCKCQIDGCRFQSPLAITWEQRKFGEVFDCTVPNNTLSRAELSYDEGTVLNVHYGDVLIKYGSVLDVQKDDIPRIPHRCREDFNGALLQDGDVIIADTAEDETTGKACEIGNLQGSAIVSGLHTMVCRPRNRMALGYLGYYLNSNAYHYQLLPLMQGIKVLSLSRSNIQKTSVSYPSAMKEQQLIASYFSQLDHLITLHQCE
jgi:type I restriction enzyme S subunit